MILTVTLNPAIDISYNLKELAIDSVNRCDNTIKTAGGKGLNVTRVVSLVGGEVCATGLLGGANGQFIIDKLNEHGIDNDFVKTMSETRNCIAILHEGNQTEILESGPKIASSEKESFLKKYNELLKRADIVVASGSIPEDLGKGFYCELIEMANRQRKKFLLDTSGETLVKSLLAKPYMVKLNKQELAQLLDMEIEEEVSIREALINMKCYNIPYVIVSLGEDGAMAMVEGEIYKVEPPKVEAINPVGSGDSTIAGFAVALEKNYQTDKLLKYGCVLGTLNALEEQTGYVDTTLIEAFMAKTTVERLNQVCTPGSHTMPVLEKL